MKKFFYPLLVIVLLLPLAACTNSEAERFPSPEDGRMNGHDPDSIHMRKFREGDKQ